MENTFCHQVGSQWGRWDLHFHTPSSYDYQNKGATNSEIIGKLLEQKIELVAITDHHLVDVNRIQELRLLADGRITILPGIELRSNLGAKPVHFIGIFPETSDLEHIKTRLYGELNLTDEGIREAGGHNRVYVDFIRASRLIHDLGGIVTIHAGAKSNSIEGISNKEEFQQQIKYDIVKDHVDILEIGQIKDVQSYLDIVFKVTNFNKPLIICSDNHDIHDYSFKVPLWVRANPTFNGLKIAIREPEGRFFLGEYPPDLLQIQKNQRKYIKQISFIRESAAPEGWFSGEIQVNPGLVAIIGNKGSGKSALADTIGFLGGSRNYKSFSFLNKNRFCNPKNGLADFFGASVQWGTGDCVSRNFRDFDKVDDIEKVKYLPQDHVEKICNEMSGGSETFEAELKSVIFSHVPETERLSFLTLDKLLDFKTSEKVNRIDSLIKNIKESSRVRADREQQTSPEVRLDIEGKIAEKRKELEVHNLTKPREIQDPKTTISSNNDDTTLAEIKVCETEKTLLENELVKCRLGKMEQEKRKAISLRIIERLFNLENDVKNVLNGLELDASNIGIKVSDLVSFSLNLSPVNKIHSDATESSVRFGEQLDESNIESVASKLASANARLLSLKDKLDEPNRVFQEYLLKVSDWNKRKTQIDEDLKNLEEQLHSLELLPKRIAEIKSEQKKLAESIYNIKTEQIEILRSLYDPVQRFINTHPIARGKLRLEFKAELVQRNFSEKFLNYIALNRKGSFMGGDEGPRLVKDLLESTDFQSSSSVMDLLDAIEEKLSAYKKGDEVVKVRLADQLVKGAKIEDLMNFLYSLEWIEGHYVLTWDGKDLSLLSPGERGALLLVFYLLIDKSDTPLVIDQPEENLDNYTVAKMLVDCIKESRKRRQVFIITHNPNLAVVCDADQVIVATMDKRRNNAIEYFSGGLESPVISQKITDILEGTRQAFNVRANKYDAVASYV